MASSIPRLYGIRKTNTVRVGKDRAYSPLRSVNAFTEPSEAGAPTLSLIGPRLDLAQAQPGRSRELGIRGFG